MDNDFVALKIEKIVNDKTLTYPLNIALASAWILGNFKGENLKVINISKISSLADYFVIASASNTTQARAMADTIKVQIKKHGVSCGVQEGMENSNWILTDFGDVIVHIFLDIARDLYDLEGLWSEGEIIEIPTSYYSSSNSNIMESTDEDSRDYF